jgi:exodeoxyribonuclease V alpha subunit
MNIFDLSSPSVATTPTYRPPSSPSVEIPSGRLQQGQALTIVGRLMYLKVMASGWGIGTINTDEHGDVKVNGNALAGLNEKSAYEFTGTVAIHKDYGVQIKVDAVGLHVPSNQAGIEKFLSQNYKGIGKKAAEKIVLYYARQPGGLKQFRVDLLANPYSMNFAVAGVKRKTSMNAAEGLKSLIYMDIATRIGGVELGDKLLRKIATYLEEPAKASKNPIEAAWKILTDNPYALIRDLDGYAFKTADIVARKIGFDLTRPERVAALVTHAITEGCNAAGHTYLTMADFNKIIHSIDPAVDVEAALDAAMELQEPMIIEDGRFYTEVCHKAEVFLAKSLAERHHKPLCGRILDKSDLEVFQAIDDAQIKIGIMLDESQRTAVHGILTSTSPIHTITADPGCGKTTIMELVVQILQGKTKLVHNPETSQNETVPYNIGFCAPTGKAAKVLNARVSRFGTRASTIHSLLGVRGSKEKSDQNEGVDVGGMFNFNHFNKLDIDLLVVDEGSMVDLALMHALVSAMPTAAHIVFLGDPKQLPSVGPGACLADLLKMPFDHHHLTTTHRNDGGILEVVHLVGLGRVDFRPRADVDFVDGLPPATEANIGAVLDRYGDALEQNAGDFARVGLLIARRKGDPNTPGWNSTYLNAVLRERYNPESIRRGSVSHIEGNAGAAAGEKIYGTRYRVGDRVIIRKNLTLDSGDDAGGIVEQVVNGDTGMILDYWMHAGNLTQVEIHLDDGRTICLPAGDVDVLDFAYAMTVHTAQGSEYDHIFFICVNGHSSFVHRGIVFTALSRAKRHLTVIGDHETVQAVVARPAPLRNSYLVQRLQKMLARQRH